MMINKSWCKIAAWFIYIFNIFGWNSIIFPRINLKYLMYFLAGINTKIFGNTPEEKYFASLRILSLFTKSFLNPFFFDIFLTCFDNSVSSFLIEVKFLAYHQNLSLYKINNIIFSC